MAHLIEIPDDEWAADYPDIRADMPAAERIALRKLQCDAIRPNLNRSAQGWAYRTGPVWNDGSYNNLDRQARQLVARQIHDSNQDERVREGKPFITFQDAAEYYDDYGEEELIDSTDI